MKLEETFMNFLLKHQQEKKRTLNFIILMESLLTAARQISFHYDSAALHKNLGQSGDKNSHGEDTMTLDLMSHNIVTHYLKESSQVIQAISEEAEEVISLNNDGRYFVYFDPLDGSSNVNHSLPVGFLFGIAKKNLKGEEDFHLRKGSEFIAAGMFTIPTGIFTFALKDAGAWRFLKDKTGGYIRPEKIDLSSKKSELELSWNAGNRNFFDKKVTNWIAENEQKYNFRYSGSLAIDFHRLLNNGGMFLYPAIKNHPDSSKNKPEGKLRLMYEAAVAAFICQQAGGSAIDENGVNILDIQPKDLHQRTALYIGSNDLVNSIKSKL